MPPHQSLQITFVTTLLAQYLFAAPQCPEPNTEQKAKNPNITSLSIGTLLKSPIFLKGQSVSHVSRL